MNTVTVKRPIAKPYPNAADSRYYAEKLADGLLCAAICIGIVTVLMFLITMF